MVAVRLQPTESVRQRCARRVSDAVMWARVEGWAEARDSAVATRRVDTRAHIPVPGAEAACHYPDLFHACLSYPDLQPIAQRCLALARLSVPHRSVYEYNNSAATWSVGPE